MIEKILFSLVILCGVCCLSLPLIFWEEINISPYHFLPSVILCSFIATMLIIVGIVALTKMDKK